MSEDILYRIESDEPIHLRSIAYRDYTDGSWSIINTYDERTTPLEILNFDFEYGVAYPDYAEQDSVHVYENQVDIAEAIEAYLKYTGGYKYVYGANKIDIMADDMPNTYTNGYVVYFEDRL